jgi:hypothetical protein
MSTLAFVWILTAGPVQELPIIVSDVVLSISDNICIVHFIYYIKYFNIIIIAAWINYLIVLAINSKYSNIYLYKKLYFRPIAKNLIVN